MIGQLRWAGFAVFAVLACSSPKRELGAGSAGNAGNASDEAGSGGTAAEAGGGGKLDENPAGASGAGKGGESAGGDSAMGGQAGESESAGAAGEAGSVDTGSCNSVAEPTVTISVETGVGDLPVATHGTIVAGTYVLTRFENFDSPYPTVAHGSIAEVTLTDGGAKIEATQDDGQPLRFNATITSETFDITCASIDGVSQSALLGPQLFSYSATPTVIQLIYTFPTVPPRGYRYTYTKQ